MALDLTFSVEQRNDNKIITVTDTTGVYNAVDNTGGWGAPNPVVTDIVAVGGAHTLELGITITTSDGTETTYDYIDLYTEFGPFADVNDLVFAITPAMVQESGTALGTADDEFPDGIYAFNYVYDRGLGSEVSESSEVLIDGRVRNAVYELLRAIPKIYDCKDCSSDAIKDAIFSRAYLDAMHASAYVSKITELLTQLAVLERMVIDGTDYVWEG